MTIEMLVKHLWVKYLFKPLTTFEHGHVRISVVASISFSLHEWRVGAIEVAKDSCAIGLRLPKMNFYCRYADNHEAKINLLKIDLNVALQYNL